MISAEMLGCSTARNKGTCSNRLNIRRDRLEERVLNARHHRLMDPALFKIFCDEFTREMNRLRMEGRPSIHAAEAEIKRIDRELDTLLNLILKGGAAERINEKMVWLERCKKDLQAFLRDVEEPPPILHPILHPSMAVVYRERVAELHRALGHEDGRAEVAEVLRSLVKEIILTPTDGELAVEVSGGLAGILHVATSGTLPVRGAQTKTPATRAGVSQVMVDAGTGFEPVTFRL
jgi:site-specific DNA recombinase